MDILDIGHSVKQLILPRFGGHEDKVVLSSSTYGRF